MDHLRDLHGGDRHPDRRLIGAGESVATALSDTLGFAEMSRVLGIVNLAVIPLILFVTRRFAALWSRRRIDLVVKSVATALSDTLGFAEMSRVLGIVNLAVIPLILFVTRRFAALWSRRRIDLVVSGG